MDHQDCQENLGKGVNLENVVMQVLGEKQDWLDQQDQEVNQARQVPQGQQDLMAGLESLDSVVNLEVQVKEALLDQLDFQAQ